MKKWKSILSATLAGIMILSTAASIGVGAANVTFTDISTHWAKDQINYLVSKDVLNGYKQDDGTYQFQPDGQVTRAEFVKMLDETFGLTATTTINYSDVKTTDWYYTYFAKAEAQGYLLNYGNSLSPNAKLTREEATTLLVRYLGLQDGEKAPASTFADYDKISTYYKDAVLAAVQAELITGYNEDGKTLFKPQGTLTRAEALTILSRAAGAIYKESAYTKDSAAPSTNAVITDGGVTLSGLTLSGRVIITEGATGGSVTLSGCTVTGTLEVRGNVSLNLDSNTKVSALTLCDTANVNVMTGCTVSTLTVNDGANKVDIRGNGTILNAIVNGSNLISTIIPSEYTIGYGLTANFAGNTYSGSSEDISGFTSVPFLSTDETYNYINITADYAGQVYYYYTNVNYTPSSTEYANMYTNVSSPLRGSFSVSTGKSYMEKAKEFSSVKNFDYVVLQLVSGQRSYAPVLISNDPTTGSGFLVDPYFTGSEIQFQAENAGTVYYYYSDAIESINIVEFLDGYDDATSSLRGSLSVRADQYGSISLSSSVLNSYPYVVIAIQNSKGQYYAPVIVSAGDNGFIDEPAITTLGTIAYKTSTNGTMYYYYTNDDKIPTPSEVLHNYKTETGGSYVKVTKNTASTLLYDQSLAGRYDYMVFCIKDSDDNLLTPYILKVYMDTGFSLDPYVSAADEITFKTQYDGSVYWYFSKTNTSISAKDFLTNYNSSASARRGKVSVYRNNAKAFTFDTSYTQTYPYIVVMLQDSTGDSYQPVVVDVKNTTNTGFTLSPYCDLTNERVVFQTSGNGYVYYYYTIAKAYSQSASDFWNSYKTNPGDYTAVTGGVIDSISFMSKDTSTYVGMMLIYVDSNNNDYYPVYVSLKTDGSAGQTANGFTLMSVTESIENTNAINVQLYAQASGVLTYTAYTSKVTDGGSGYKVVTTGSTVSIDVSKKYKYLLVELDGYEDMLIDLTETYSRNENIDDGSTVNGTGFTSPSWDTVDGVPYFFGVATVDGIVTCSVSNVSGTTKTQEVKKGDLVMITLDFDLNDYNNISGSLGSIIDKLYGNSGFTFTAQLTDTYGNVYQSVRGSAK